MIKTTEMMLEELKNIPIRQPGFRVWRKRVYVFRLYGDYMRLTGQFRDIYWQAVSADRPIFF